MKLKSTELEHVGGRYVGGRYVDHLKKNLKNKTHTIQNGKPGDASTCTFRLSKYLNAIIPTSQDLYTLDESVVFGLRL